MMIWTGKVNSLHWDMLTSQVLQIRRKQEKLMQGAQEDRLVGNRKGSSNFKLEGKSLKSQMWGLVAFGGAWVVNAQR